MKAIIITLLAFVYCVSAYSSFIGEGKRAELFELLDEEVGVFRFKIPDNEFKTLKKTAQVDLDEWYALIGQSELNLDGSIDSSAINARRNNEMTSGVFKTQNVTLTFEVKNIKKTLKHVTFSLGGHSSRIYSKQGFNVKIGGGEDLFGRSQFRIRPDAREPSFLRSKLACDMHNRLGIDSISAGYITLYINDEYMGLYILLDSIKPSWIEHKFKVANTTNLYECSDPGSFLTVESSGTACENQNDQATDRTEWIEFLTALDNAKTVEDIEPIFEVDQFLYEIAFEYLFGSWDHFLNLGHNYYLYKQENGKWTYYLYDFDAELGQETVYGVSGLGLKPLTNFNYATYSFQDWARPHHLTDILIFSNTTRFDNILKEVVTDIFNPATLFPRIDELKQFIKPYVKRDKTPNSKGELPGRINKLSKNDYSYEEWDANSEFTSVKTPIYGKSFGLKFWILNKYRYVCEAYNMECDTLYLSKKYKYTVDKRVESRLDFNIPIPLVFRIAKDFLKHNSSRVVQKFIDSLMGVNNNNNN